MNINKYVNLEGRQAYYLSYWMSLLMQSEAKHNIRIDRWSP